MTHRWKPCHDDGRPDDRYTVRLEFCGAPRQLWVARFCEEWLGSNELFADSVALCHAYHEVRMEGLA